MDYQDVELETNLRWFRHYGAEPSANARVQRGGGRTAAEGPILPTPAKGYLFLLRREGGRVVFEGVVCSNESQPCSVNLTRGNAAENFKNARKDDMTTRLLLPSTPHFPSGIFKPP